MRRLSGFPNAIRLTLTVAGVAGLLWWEHVRSLRRVSDSKVVRDVRNLAMAGLAALAVQYLEAPVAGALIRRAQRTPSGLLAMTGLPRWITTAAAILLLDYTLYIWHRLTHQVAFLWRFHQVHHVDREMDASTALRFHFGEITISVLFRAAQVRLIGPSAMAYSLWQTFLFCCILFHHANIRLPLSLERRLAMLLMTPRLHGIHHSVVPGEVNSNWSSGLTCWDWLHGTLRTRVPQECLVLGVAGLRDDCHQGLVSLLALPLLDDASKVPMPVADSREPVSALAE